MTTVIILAIIFTMVILDVIYLDKVVDVISFSVDYTPLSALLPR